MLVKNKDASFITLRNQNRTLYANYVVQKNKVDSGCQLRVNLENGSTGEASIITKIKQGEQETTAAERDNYLALNACPITPVAPVDPYSTDNIYLALTTNAATYKSATSGSWITITASEYTAVQSSVSNTTLAGTDASTFNLTYNGIYTLNTWMAANRSSAITPAIPASNYVFAFAIIVATPLQLTAPNAMSNILVYGNNTTGTYSNFSQIGGSIPTAVAGKNYYVLKGNSAINAPTNGLLSITTPGGSATSNSQTAAIPYVTGLSGTGLQINYTTVSLPITTNTTLNSLANGWGIGIQALTSPNIQWVT